jgi:hypothetical protein
LQAVVKTVTNFPFPKKVELGSIGHTCIVLVFLLYRCCVYLSVCPFVAACNRTYFGDVGRTYDLEIRRPREDRLPFLCHLNFTAGGKDLGDLVQVSV